MHFFLICSLTGCCKNEQVSVCLNFDKSESQIWCNPSDALDSLAIFSPEKLEMTEKMHWYLLSELANSRLNRSGSPDSVMMMVIDYYNQWGLQSYAARAYYVQGLEYMIQSCGSNVASFSLKVGSKNSHLRKTIHYCG